MIKFKDKKRTDTNTRPPFTGISESTWSNCEKKFIEGKT